MFVLISNILHTNSLALPKPVPDTRHYTGPASGLKKATYNLRGKKENETTIFNTVKL